MEESSEVHSEDNNSFPEKNKKRMVKTPAQIEALEKFYDEYKYPTESMKSQIAESLGLTEKQISGWFCHRRLKDKKLLNSEAYANGRQDRSSGVIQDRGSGHMQDSCGSTKQGDHRHFDPREVESRRFTGQDFSAAGPAYELGSHYTGNYGSMDDTSSGSSSPLQDRYFPQNEDPLDMATSIYLTQNENIVPIDVKGVRGRNGPSGYLKVKGQVENAAITAVKRQLGRHYQEDGPPLGVEFQPLPPGSFESSIRDPVNEPLYAGHPILPHSPDVDRIHKLLNHGTRYEVYNSKLISQDSELDGTRFKITHGSDHCENYSHHQLKRTPSLPSHGEPFHGRNSLIKMNEDSVGEPSVYDSGDNYEMRAKLAVGGMRRNSVSSHHLSPYGGKASYEQSAVINESKPSNLKLKHSESLDVKDRVLYGRMAKTDVQEEKLYAEMKGINEYSDSSRMKIHPTDEMRVVKRVGDEFPQRQYVRKASMVEMPPWTNQIKRSAVEMPSSFSEDETAETSSSID